MLGPASPSASFPFKDKPIHRRFTFLLCPLAALPLHAAMCGVDEAALDSRIADLEPAYGLMLSDISCDLPTLSAHVMMCDSADSPKRTLWSIGRQDDLAWVYAVENATGLHVDLSNPQRNEGFLPPATPAPMRPASARF